MSEDRYNKILSDITAIKHDIETLEHDVRSEMKLHEQEAKYKFDGHERRISFTEKMVFGAAGLILVGVLSAIITMVVR